MATVVLVYILMMKICMGSETSFKRYCRKWSPLLSLSLLAILTILLPGLVYPIELGKSWNQRKADALVAYDVECHVVHVALSPWRFYLDVNRYARRLRDVRLWFGV